jgi:hypothetical protein
MIETGMKIKKDSYLYKIAYGRIWNTNKKDKEINNSNLCSFFWRIVFSVLIIWPIMGVIIIVFGVILAILYCFATPIAFFFGANKPTIFKKNDDFFAPIENWPTFYGHRIIPIVPISIGVAIFGLIKWASIILDFVVDTFILIVYAVVSIKSSFTGTTIVVPIWIQMIFGLVVLAGFMIFIGKKTGFWKLFFTYLEAKKDKMCPLIIFEEVPEIEQE